MTDTPKERNMVVSSKNIQNKPVDTGHRYNSNVENDTGTDQRALSLRNLA